MKNDIADKIGRKVGLDLVDILSNKLSGTDLNSLLMKVFANRASKISPAALLRNYEINRFVQPADSDYLELAKKTLETLEFFSARGFVPKQLSPLLPLGTCSVLGPVDQDRVVSATRNGEVLSDATNALALEIASHKKQDNPNRKSKKHIKYCGVQRHMRAQTITKKGFAPHFTIGFLVTAGRDEGNFSFEFSAIADHINTWTSLLQQVFFIDDMYIKLQPRGRYRDDFIEKLQNHLNLQSAAFDVRIDEQSNDNNYYHGVQYKVVMKKGGHELEIADGGMVDWTQKLLNDKKERYCISGFGLELVNKIDEGLL
jgi:hypothetical protein